MRRKLINTLNDWNREGVLSVMGPTGSGKTSLVVDFLKSLPREDARRFLLVNVDSVSFYKGLDIGSAKVRGAEREAFNWCALDYLEATEASTTKRFLEEVEGLLIEALKSSRPVILVGGSGFYERALVEGISPGEPSDPVFQKSLEEFSNEELHARLLRNDVRWGEKIFPNDRYRVTRYLDLVERQALSWSTLKGPKLRNRELAKIWKQTSTLVLKADVDRKLFKAPLAARIDQMFDEGWIEEVQCLLKNFPPECPGLQSIGYRELCAGLANPQSDDFDAIKSDILHSHLHYVKKQQTWLRPLLRCG